MDATDKQKLLEKSKEEYTSCTIKKTVDDRAPVAHLVVHRAVTREVVSSRLPLDQHSGSLNN